MRRVQAALREQGSRAEVIELAATARTAEDAARALGVAVGAIVKSLLFTIDGDPVMALVAGDRRCDTRALPAAFGRQRSGAARRRRAGARRRPASRSAASRRSATRAPLPTAIDDSLGRFETVYAAAGHPFCVFPTTMLELSLLTGGAVTKRIAIAEPV